MLNHAIKAFQDHVAGLPASERKPSVEVLKQYFNAKQISALWMRLSVSRNKQELTVKKAWEGLCKLSTNSKA